MYPAAIANFEHLLAPARDDALLRFGLGNYKRSIATAAHKGDKQADRAMTAFTSRIVKQHEQST